MEKRRHKDGIVFLRGRKTILRPLNKEGDLIICQRWINDPEIRQYVKTFLPTTKQREEEWFDRHEDNSVRLAIDTMDGVFIGVISIAKIDYRSGRATTGNIIGEKDYQNKGYGTDAKMALLEYAFHTLNMRKMVTEVLASNKRSIRYNEKCGYREVGRLKENDFVNGRFVDRVIMEVFREEWEQRRKAYMEKQ